MTNWTGITSVESNRCNALLIYLICSTAVVVITAKSPYVSGVIIASQGVYKSIDASPLVESAV